MNEDDFECELGEWIHADRVEASAWVLPSVVEHARRHSNQGHWVRLRGWLASLLVAPAGPRGRSRPRPSAVAAGVTVAFAIVLALGLLLPTTRTSPEHQPAFLPAPELPGLERDTGAIGSLWLERAEGRPDSHITLHPDGTIVRTSIAPGQPAGIGVWRPTGERSLSAVVAYADADIANHLRPGTTRYRADWKLEEAATTAEVTWSATMTPADGSGPIDVTGIASLERLERGPLPAQAKYPTPPEPDWQLSFGPMGEGPGSGIVAAMAPRCDTTCDLTEVQEFRDPPEYLVLHGDGTAFLASFSRDDGAGLWVRTGPDTRALTSWLSVPYSSRVIEQVAQLIGTQQILVLTGDREAFRDRRIAARRHIEPMDEPLPEVDPALWPTTGSVWLTPLEEGTAITAHLTDGTVVALDPRFGTGAGYWQPLDADTIASSVGFSTHAEQDHHVWSEAVVDPDGETMRITYRHQDESGGPVENGQATAARLRIEP